ncbi:MAG: hypothetical protein MJY51_02730 [Bacteroidales bacterium]|nr:hypothetical protein [Bacteroidales bacterium]
MLNRRILRIKAFKTIYSYAENSSMSLKEVEAQLERSCESTRDLYLFLLSIVNPLTEEARARIEAAKAKFNPTEEEKHPNLKFVENAIAVVLAEDPDFCKLVSKKKLSWEQYDVFLRHLYESIRQKKYFLDYMSRPERSLKEDAGLWAKIFENEFEDNEELEAILEDMCIWWNDDVAYALNWCCRTMDKLGTGVHWDLPRLYLSEIQHSSEDDHGFVLGIVRKAVSNFDRYYESVASLTPKWDKNRICYTDLALIVAGLAENEAFPHIPANVTINEYVEISKFYSTPESRGFVNGLLDKLINKR